MSDRSLNVTVGAKDNASPVFQKIGNSAKTMGQSIKESTQGLSQAGGFKALLDNAGQFEQEFNRAGQAITGFGVAVTATIGVGLKNFASLEQAMANVASIAPEMNIGAVTDQIRALAVELGTPPTGLAEGLYDLISSGIQAADAMDVLRVSATAAKAGMTDTAVASRAITAVLNAYGLEAERAGDISDVLFNIVNEGVVTFEGLANNLSQVIPLAASLGVGMEEVGAAFKGLTLQGFSAATAETGIAGFMRAAINPTEELTEAVREYGYASVEALIQAEGLSGLLRVLEDATGGSATAMMELLGTSEATTAALALLKDGADGFAASSQDMFASMQDGALTAATAARQMDTLQGSIDRFQASAEVASGVFGEMFAGIAGAGIDAAAMGIQGLTSAVQALPGPAQEAVALIGGLGGAAAVAAGGMLLLAPRIVETRNAMATLGGMRGVIGMLAGAVSPLGLAIASLGVGVLLVSENMRRGAEDAKNYAASVQTLTKTIEELKLAGEDTRAVALETLQAQVDSHVALLDNMEEGALTFYETLKLAEQGIDPTTYSNILTEDFNRAIELADDVNIRIAETLSNPNIDASAYNREVQRLLDTIEVTAEGSNIDEVFQEILDLDITKFRDDAGEVETIWESMLEAMRVDPGDVFGSVREQVDAARAASEQYRAEQERLREEQQQMREEWIASALAIGGFDDALSMLNLSGAATDVTMFAESWQTANEALDNTFRVIVGTTNAIISQVDGIQSWADELIGVRGELGLIDDLLAGGFIDETIYNKAQTAYDEISTSVGNIRNNLLAVQAIQAPFIAEAVAQTERWAEQLRAMPEDVQRTTLALMDQQTVQQTLDLVNLASAASFDLLGDSGQAAWEAMFMGAAQANPMLLETAEAFGYIKQTSSGIEFNWDAILSGGDAINQLVTQVENLVDTLREIHNLPPIAPEVDASGIEQAQTEVEAVLNTVQEADGTTAYMVMTVNAETGELETAGEIIDSVLSADGKTANVTIETTGGEIVEGIIDMATGEITMNVGVNVIPTGYSAAAGGAVPGSSMGADAFKAFLGIPETVTTTIAVEGDEQITEARDAINELQDRTVTVSVDVNSTAVGDLMELIGSINDVGAATLTVDVVIGTNELDTGLTQFGIGTGGGGGAAGYTAPSVSVDVVIGNNELDTLISDEPLTVNVDANTSQAQMKIDFLGSGEDGAREPITIMVDADTSAAAEALLGIAAAAEVASGMTVSIPVDTPGSDTGIGQLQGVAGAAAAADALSVSVPVATPGSGDGIAQLQGVAGAGAAADAISVSIPVSVSGASSAIGQLNSVAAAAAAASRTVTISVVTAYSSVGSPGVGATARHGGIPGLASGGIVELAEAGPEVLHFASGGTLPIFDRGYYAVPTGTYVEPNNSVGSGRNRPIEININAPVFGVDELRRVVEDATVTALDVYADVKQDRDEAIGAWRR